jgi:hypothetical protein
MVSNAQDYIFVFEPLYMHTPFPLWCRDDLTVINGGPVFTL